MVHWKAMLFMASYYTLAKTKHMKQQLSVLYGGSNSTALKNTVGFSNHCESTWTLFWNHASRSGFSSTFFIYFSVASILFSHGGAEWWLLKTILNVGHVCLVGSIQVLFNPLEFSKAPLVQHWHVNFFYGPRSSTNVANKYINKSHSVIHNRRAKVLSYVQQPVVSYSRL